jgi:aspartate carbamoyltransferase catalytic subunit
MTTIKKTAYTWVTDLTLRQTTELFDRARSLQKKLKAKERVKTLKGKQVAILFNEPSTRTKLSFQLATQRLGGHCLIIDDFTTSSMAKGETFLDTLWTVHALGPDLLVVRCGGEEPLEQWVSQTELPVINGGWGAKSHPTQALLDVFTLLNRYEDLEGLKVVFVGDIDHSRVAASSIQLMRLFGVQVKICAPSGFCQAPPEGVEVLGSLPEALKWCDVFYGLRVQLERHQGQEDKVRALAEFRDHFSLNEQGLKLLNPKAVIMHPGPVNWGVEFHPQVQQDPRTLVGKMVENGVYVRAALMELLMEES